jgi:hypothetical protein
MITVIGLAFTAAPFFLAHRVNEDFGENHALLSSTLTNIGTTIPPVELENAYYAHQRAQPAAELSHR